MRHGTILGLYGDLSFLRLLLASNRCQRSDEDDSREGVKGMPKMQIKANKPNKEVTKDPARYSRSHADVNEA